MDVFSEIKNLLEKNKIDYKFKEHPPTRTSEEAAFYRNEPIKIGAKALILKTDKEFIMAVIPGNKKINSKKLKLILKTKNLRFATEQELLKISNCTPGSVPPFGNLFNISLFIDKLLLENEFVAFNAGSLTKSIKIKKQDYLSLVNAKIESFIE